MSRFGYGVRSLLGAIAVIAGIGIVVYSMEDESVYWLIFGLAVGYGALRELREMDDRADVDRYESRAEH